jgi:hypothetical protein
MNMDQLRESLLRTDEEFRHLSEQHQELDSRISELSGQLYRSDTEELEEATLKKRKLQVKDQMETLLRRRREREAQGTSPSLQPQAQG